MSNELEIMRDYADAGFRVFALWNIVGGKCECGDEECKAVGKHPRIGAWQNSPVWSVDQLDAQLQYIIETGFGVCLDDHLVIDIDPRNGGDESYDKLVADTGIDFEALSGFVVRTGGNGRHIYFSRPKAALLGHLDGYKGIDFKGNGFVVGCGSGHASGGYYERSKGFPDELTLAPERLLAMLAKPMHHRTEYAGEQFDVTDDELMSMLSYIPNADLDYETFIQVGMALHSSGASFGMWDSWAATSAKYDGKDMEYKWHSFGKSANPVTIGTLIYMAEQNGWARSVTFDLAANYTAPASKPTDLPFSVDHVDLLRPPGFVGKLAEWINANSYYLRENIAAISALTAVGNIGGLTNKDDVTGVTSNIMSLCVAGSGTGKESVQQCFADLMRAGGMAGCIAGDIKSKQEIVRNLIEHQAVCYATDEIGEILRTIENAKKKGGAAYLEGVTGQLMSAFTKTDGYMAVSGDVRRDMLKEICSRLAQAARKMEEDGDKTGRLQLSIDSLENLRNSIDTLGGLPKPFVSLIGFTTLESLEGALSSELAKNGFLNRAILIEERETNPKPNKKYTKTPLPDPYKMTLAGIGSTGSSDRVRIEYYKERRSVPSDVGAKALLSQLLDWQWHFAEHHKQTTGFEAVARRAYEYICKVSLILAIPGGLRTAEHVTWAAKLIKRDLDEKIRLIQYTDSKLTAAPDSVSDGLSARVVSLCGDEGVYVSTASYRLARKGVTKAQILSLIDAMVSGGQLKREGPKIFNV
jgi:hypothetical protein